MRNWINIVANTKQYIKEDYLSEDETKFWYKDGFLFHDINTHHIRYIIDNFSKFGLTDKDIAIHPYSNSNIDDDELDNDDMGIFEKVFSDGWVRGGHYLDTMLYHEFNEIRPDDIIYLEGCNTRSVRKCVRDCIIKWPQVNSFHIDNKNNIIKLHDKKIDLFIKYGSIK